MTYMLDTNICISSITLAELGYDWPGLLLYLDAWLWRHLPGRAVCESIIQKRNPEFELPPIVRQYAILQISRQWHRFCKLLPFLFYCFEFALGFSSTGLPHGVHKKGSHLMRLPFETS